MASDRQHLGNLLARIHKDGDHYQDKHGTETAVVDADTIFCRLLQFAESMAEGPCWGSETVDESCDCPSRINNGNARHFDWCRRCQAKYWALGRIGNEESSDA